MSVESNPTSGDHRCGKCGATLNVRTLRGLCPNCLALFAFGAEAQGGSGADTLGAAVRYIGDYELMEEIGRGGMGVVFKAKQSSLNRDVAVKMILAGEFAGPEERRRFQREAEAAAQLRHPNIVAIHEVGEHEGRSYFSMDFIEGKNLSVVLKRDGRMMPARATALVKTLAEAVHFAHQRGTLHRDLKPQNVLLGTDGQPHILDFGLARPVERDGTMTRTGDIMGSPAYMPPEQAAGRQAEIGPASDVYALGAILYEALAGRQVFVGESPMDVLTRVINEEPTSLRRLVPGIPADLETICMKCLEKRPERRYHSARALVEELERFLNFEPILAKPAGKLRKGWSWAQRNPWVFAASLGLLVLALLCVAFGFWEQNQALHWQIESVEKTSLAAAKEADLSFTAKPHPAPQKPSSPVQSGEADALMSIFLLILPGGLLFLNFVRDVFRKHYRQHLEGGPAASGRDLVSHAVAGMTGALFGMYYIMLQIHYWSWNQPSTWSRASTGLAGITGAVVLIWMGMRMVWEALGLHETSRYHGLVAQALTRQLASQNRRRVLFSVLAVAWWLDGIAQAVMLVEKPSREKSCFIIASMTLTAALTAWMTWMFRARRRLFTFICAPSVLAFYALLFIALGRLTMPIEILLALDLAIAMQVIVTMALLTEVNPASGKAPPKFPASPWVDLGYGVLLFLGIFALIHGVEDARGAAAWKKCKQAALARGQVLDWTNYVPPTVPDDQNVFAAAHMQEWFTGHGQHALSKKFWANAPWSIEGIATNVTVAVIRLALPDETPPVGWTVFNLENAPTHGQFQEIISNVLGSQVAAPSGQLIIQRAKSDIQPAKIVFVYKQPPIQKDLAALFPNNIENSELISSESGRISFVQDGLITGHVVVQGVYSAEEIMDWNRRCQPDLNAVREALRRPIARMEGGYYDPTTIPVPAFISMRTMSQMLAASCEACLMRGDPQGAVEQMKLIHDSQRLLLGPPNGQPETLVASMINVAIGGLYVGTVQHGLDWHAWGDPQLEELQRELATMKLAPYVQRSFLFERAVSLQYLDILRQGTGLSTNLTKALELGKWDTVFLALVPVGWLDQNKVSCEEIFPRVEELFDPSSDTVNPEKARAERLRSEGLMTSGFAPYTLFSRIAIPNYMRAFSTTCMNQTYVNQCYLVCGLERYRMAHGNYPESLDELKPQYIDHIPNDIIGGKPPVYHRGGPNGFELTSKAWDDKKQWTWPKIEL